MRLFIGYGYNAVDKWIEEYVFPLAAAFRCEVVHGKAVYGGVLPEEVVKTIRTSHAMIGFTTRREETAAGSGIYTTHDWVVQELVTANAQGLPWVEVRQEGVKSPGGILEAATSQRIDYKESDRAVCLVKVVEALRRLSDITCVALIRIGPEPVAEAITELLEKPGFLCEYQTLLGNIQSDWQRAPIVPIKGSIFAQLKGLAADELVRLNITAGGKCWRSNYESVDTVDIRLKEKN
jgi:hypothetical protein